MKVVLLKSLSTTGDKGLLNLKVKGKRILVTTEHFKPLTIRLEFKDKKLQRNVREKDLAVFLQHFKNMFGCSLVKDVDYIMEVIE